MTFDTLITLLIVGAAVYYLYRKMFGARADNGCGSGGNCCNGQRRDGVTHNCNGKH